MTDTNLDNPLTLKLGHEELIIRRRYEVLSIINDFCFPARKHWRCGFLSSAVFSF